MLIAAVARPSGLRTGAASEMSPIDVSCSVSAKPCARALRTSAMIASSDVFVCCVYEVTEGIATITIRRAEKLSALLPEMILVMADLIETARRDPKVRAVVLRGDGSSFCAGDDLHQEDRFRYGPPDMHTRLKMG